MGEGGCKWHSGLTDTLSGLFMGLDSKGGEKNIYFWRYPGVHMTSPFVLLRKKRTSSSPDLSLTLWLTGQLWLILPVQLPLPHQQMMALGLKPFCEAVRWGDRQNCHLVLRNAPNLSFLTSLFKFSLARFACIIKLKGSAMIYTTCPASPCCVVFLWYISTCKLTNLTFGKT